MTRRHLLLLILSAAAIGLWLWPVVPCPDSVDRPYDFSVDFGWFTYHGTRTGPVSNRVLGALPWLGQTPFSVDLYGMTYRGKTKNLIDDYILYFGAWEKPLLFWMRDWLEASGGEVFLDVGANTGQHSMFLSGFSRRVLAVEPYPPVLERFRAMVEANGLGNIEILPVGFGNSEERLPFFEPPDMNFGTGSFVEGFADVNTRGGELQIVVGDDYLEARGVDRVDLAKIDIEGYEKPALQGLRRTLEQSRPVVVMELNSGLEESFASRADLLAVLPGDYDYLELREGRCRCSGHYLIGEYSGGFAGDRQATLVLFPAELRERIAAVRAPVDSHCDGG